MFLVVALLFILSSAISIYKQSTMTIDTELQQLETQTLPNQLQSLAATISTEILPLITTSKLMTNDQFIEAWIKGDDYAETIPLVEEKLKNIKALTGSESTFYVVDGPTETEYFMYADKMMRVPLKDFQFREFYPNFLASGKDYELNLQDMQNGTFMLYINYKSKAINPRANKPYSVAGLGIKADQFIGMVRKLKIGSHGHAMLVTENGDIQVPYQDASLDEIRKEDLSGLLRNKQDVVVDEIIINDHTYYLGALWVPTLNRYLIMEVPRGQITAPIYDQLWELSMFIGVSLLISLIIIQMAVRALTRPLLAVERDIQYVTKNLDLDYRIETYDRAEVGSVAVKINSLLATIKESLVLVNDAVLTTDQHLDGLNKHTDELNQAKEAEQRSLEQIFSSTKSITEQSSLMADLAYDAGTLSHQGNTELGHASTEVNNSLTYLEDLEQDMNLSQSNLNELNVHIEKILSVLEVITSISEQTNLLALNAAIEAARAGEHGRGFAVVADEVRSLSQRTSESTSEIQEIIDQLRGASNEVNQQIDIACKRSTQTLDGQKIVAGKVDELNKFLQRLFEMNEQIAVKVGAQNSAVTEINQNLEELSAQNEQTTSLCTESRHVAEFITGEMGGLRAKVQQFQGV